ncbi:MAG: PKD domain-containing protein [Bacteroidia bacterium]|nr:PKD domain-containing protein [Bacteroidia bacterium]
MHTRLRFWWMLLALSASAQAQVTYTSSDYAAIGDTMRYSRTAAGLGAFDFAQTGANFAWNYASLGIATQGVTEVQNPNNAGYYLSFLASCVLSGGNPFTCPGQWNALTDIAIQSLDAVSLGNFQLANAVTHYRRTASAADATVLGFSIEANGITIPYTVTYSQPDTVYQFPLAYLGSDSSASRWEVDLTASGLPIQFKSFQTRSYTVEGWGSLATPYGAFASVLKVRVRTTRRDTLIQNGTAIPVPAITEVRYQWLDKAYGLPVLEASGTVLGGAEVISSVRFLDSLRCLDPQAGFSYSPLLAFLNPVTQSVQVSFNNQSDNASQFAWDFGDGGTSTQEDPSHTFTAGGLYTVQLIACNPVCSPLRCDTTTLPVVVVDSTGVVAAFFLTPPAGICTGGTVQATNLSLNAVSYAWNFGDGSTSTDTAPSHTYTAPGSYTVTLIATGAGSADTLSLPVTVSAPPVPDLGPDLSIPSNQSVTLSPGSGFALTLWSNGSIGSSLTLQGSALGVGTHEIGVTVSNAQGCSASDTVVITVTPATRIDDPALRYGIGVHPNPATDLLAVTAARALTGTLRLLTLDGREALPPQTLRGTYAEMDLHLLPAGLYLLEIRTPEGPAYQRIAKK